MSYSMDVKYVSKKGTATAGINIAVKYVSYYLEICF
jgi:hypothetical protein